MSRGCGNDPRAVLSAMDAEAVAEFRGYLLARKAVAAYEAAGAPVGPVGGSSVAAGLLALVDRAERGVLLPAEAGLLRAGIRALGDPEAVSGDLRPVRGPDGPDVQPAPFGASGGDSAAGKGHP